MYLPEEISDRIIALSVTDKSILNIWTHFPAIRWYISEANVDWKNVSSYNRLSEDFIRSFSDLINWHYVSQWVCKYSDEFILEFNDFIDWDFAYNIHLFDRNRGCYYKFKKPDKNTRRLETIGAVFNK